MRGFGPKPDTRWKKASQADEAIRKVNSFSPTIVLTDHDMPGLTGLEMLEDLRRQENYTTVIFVSARGESALVARGSEGRGR